MTGVESGSTPAATAYTLKPWPRSGSPIGVPSASRDPPQSARARRTYDRIMTDT